MDTSAAIAALGALAHQHRLAIYRLLVAAGPGGLSAGTLAARLQLVPSSLTFHVQALMRAGLITQRRASRQLFYSTDYVNMNALVGYLTENCCGEASSCAPGCQTVTMPARSRKLRRATA